MRACGNCGLSGHNIRTCGNAPVAKATKAKKPKAAKAPKAPKPPKVAKVRRNKYGTPTMCKYCRQREGHSAATCSVRAAHNETAKREELTMRENAVRQLAAMGFDVGAMIVAKSGYPDEMVLKIVKSIEWNMDVRAIDRTDPNSRIEVNSRLIVRGLSAGHTGKKNDAYYLDAEYEHQIYPYAADSTHNSVDELCRVIGMKQLPAVKFAGNRGLYIDSVLISGVPTNEEKVVSRIKINNTRARRAKYGAKPKKEKKVSFLELPKNIL